MKRLGRIAACGMFSLLLVVPAVSQNKYLQHNLIADTAGKADVTDPNLINPWGIALSASSPFWFSDAGSGLGTLFNSTTGAIPGLRVTVPPGAGSTGLGTPTGQVFNGTTVFTVAAGKAAAFIFSTLDGTISGWNPTVDATHAIKVVDNSGKGVIYTGLAIGGTTGSPELYAANFGGGTVDVFDGNFAPVVNASAFKDPKIPAGYSPFNVQTLNGQVYVAYAKQDPTTKADVPGAGFGYVDVYDLSGTLVKQLIAGGKLNAPWGLAIAPPNFGDFSNALLVGNFGDGKIYAYDLTTGALKDSLHGLDGNEIEIEGLWALQVGNGKAGGDANAVYFTAGPGNQSHGLFGSLQAGPVLSASSVVNGASFATGIASNTWVTLLGSNLAPKTRTWAAADIVNGKLPTSLDGVSVTINGKPAYIYYISPTQLNVLAPVDATLGPVQVAMANNGLASGNVTAQLATYAPAFFLLKDGKSIAAQHANFSLIGAATLYPNASSPAKPGETIVMYGTGFGTTTPNFPDGETFPAALPLPANPVVTFGTTAGTVTYAGLISPGLYQINVTIPDSTPDGDIPVTAQYFGVNSPAGPIITVLK